MWLNDEVINFHMNMLQERDGTLCAVSNSSRQPSHFFSIFFMNKLLEFGTYTYGNVSSWSKKIDVFTQDKIFVPINIDNSHWVMLIVYLSIKTIKYYDSMGGNGGVFLEAMLHYLKDESEQRSKFRRPRVTFDITDWILTSAGNRCPQQNNGYDCRAFTVLHADFISDDLPLHFSQANVDSFRMKMVAAILRGNLDYSVTG